MSKNNEIGTKMNELLEGFLEIIIEKLDFNKVNLESIDDLVDEIYKQIINDLTKSDKIILNNNSILVEKNKEKVENVPVNLNGVFYDKKRVIELLKNYIKSRKKNVYYVKKFLKSKDFKFDMPSIIELQNLFKQGIISLSQDEDNSYSFKINLHDERVDYNFSKMKHHEDYISEEVIKSIIRKSIKSITSEIAKKVVAPAMTATVISSLIGSGSSYIAEDMQPIFHVIKKGENITLIAKQYGVSPEDIIKYNPNINPDLVVPGQRIIVKYEEIEKQQSKKEEKDVNTSYNAEEVYIGIDVSDVQGKQGLNLEIIHDENGLDFAIVKSHNFVWSNADAWDDSYLDDFVEQVKAIKEKDPDFDFSIYFLPDVRAQRSEEDSKIRVKKVIQLLKKLEEEGVYCTLPIYLDVEQYDPNSSYVEHNQLPSEIIKEANRIKAASLTAQDLIEKGDEFVKANYPVFYNFKIYVNELKSNGYCPGIYTSSAAIEKNNYDMLCEYAGIPKECHWIAEYNNKPHNRVNLSDKDTHDMSFDGQIHQFRIGKVDGFNGEVDLNSTNRDYGEYIETNEFNHVKKRFNIIELFKSILSKGNKEDQTLEGKSFMFEKNDCKYENGILSIEINGKVINAYCEEDPSQIEEIDPFVIIDIETGQEYTITRIKNGYNNYILIIGGLYSLMSLNATPAFKEFYSKLLTKAKEKLKNNKKSIK